MSNGRQQATRRVTLAVGLVVILAAVAGCARHHEETPATEATQAVTTLTVQATTTDVGAEVPGIVRPVLEARLAPKIMSKVAAITVREGDRVRRG